MSASHTVFPNPAGRLATLVLAACLPLLPQAKIQPGTPATVGPPRIAPATPAIPATASDPDVNPGGPVISTTVKVVIAPTTVTDSNGQYVSGLLPRDFYLYDNGKLQRIAQDVAFEPLSLVIAIQASANMEGLLPKIQRIGALLNDQVLGENGRVAVLAFDHRIQTLTDFTSDTTKIQEALKKLKPGSSSSVLNDAAMAGIRMLRHEPSDRRRVLLIVGETRDNSSELRPRDVLTEAEFDNVTIYPVDVSHMVTTLTSKPMPPRPPAVPPSAQHMPDGSLATPTTQIQNDNGNGNWVPMFTEIFRGVKGLFIDNPCELYAKFTGGREYSFATQGKLERVLQDIGDDLHSQYLLSYTPNNLNEAGFHEIKVTVNRPALKIRTRPGYWVAARPE